MDKTPIEGQDFKYVKAKMPLHDKDGNDVRGDKMGAGGRRKENGRQSVQAYDFEDLTPEGGGYGSTMPERYGGYEQEQQCGTLQDVTGVLEAFNGLLDIVTKLLEDNPEVALLIKRGRQYMASKAKAGIAWAKGAVGNIPKKRKRLGKNVVSPEKADSRVMFSSSVGCINEKSASNQQKSQRIFLSREEALQELFKALRSYNDLKNSVEILAGANYIDVEALGFNGVIATLEAVIQQYPMVLDVPEQHELLNLLNSGFSDTEKERALLTLGLALSDDSNDEGSLEVIHTP